MLNDCGWLSAHHAHHHAHLFKLRDSAPRPDLCQITGWKLWPSDWPSTWDMLRYCYSMSFEASINGGHSWKPMESQGGLVSPKSVFLKPARFPFQMIFIGADSRRTEPVFSLTHLRLWVVKTWYMSSLVMSGGGIPSYRDTKITSTWVLIQSWFWNSPRILHLFPTPDPSAPSAQGFRTFARFRPLSLQA